jgi:hypothetical protein
LVFVLVSSMNTSRAGSNKPAQPKPGGMSLKTVAVWTVRDHPVAQLATLQTNIRFQFGSSLIPLWARMHLSPV